MKRTTLITSLLPLALVCGASSARAAESNPQEEAAITKTAEAFVEAFQKGDAKAVAAFWAPDGDYVDATGRVLQGRPAIEKDFENLFAENKGLKLRIEVASLKFPTPDTAVEDGTRPESSRPMARSRAGPVIPISLRRRMGSGC